MQAVRKPKKVTPAKGRKKMPTTTPHVIDTIDLTNDVAESVQVDRSLASRVISMFDEGFTVPFIARYRKEATGGLQPSVLHRLREKMIDRKSVIENVEKALKYFGNKSLLTQDLSQKLRQCKSNEEIKLLTEPLKPKGPRTLAARAKSVNLEPLAMDVLKSGNYVDLRQRIPAEALKLFKNVDGVVEGVKHIVANLFANDLDLIRHAEQLCAIHQPSVVTSKKRSQGKKEKSVPMEVDSYEPSFPNHRDVKGGSANGRFQKPFKDDLVTFEKYLNFSCRISSLHSHQILAINRASERDVISVKITFPVTIVAAMGKFVADKYLVTVHPAHFPFVHAAFTDGWTRLIEPHLARSLRQKLTAQAQDTSLDVFAENLRGRLMTAPLRWSSDSPSCDKENSTMGTTSGQDTSAAAVISSTSGAPGDRVPVLGLDPGWRHGCKWAACDPHGNVLATGIVWPPNVANHHHGKRGPQGAPGVHDNGLAKMTAVMQCHGIHTIGLGNGQGSRPTGRWVAELITMGHFNPLLVRYAVVSEAGASWYSASALADAELPQLDVSFRGAVSIARRLQDPLSELVKVEPKHLGVGMYQHDLPEKRLEASVNALFEECISFVGVDLNAAPLHVLSRISGLNETKAKSILDYRSFVGAFRTRSELLKVKGIGPTTFAQCAGFVRVRPTYSLVSMDGSKDVDMISISSDDDLKMEPEDMVGHKSGTKRPHAGSSNYSRRKRKQPRDILDRSSFNPLDQTAVHPDTYDIAKSLIDFLKCALQDVGKSNLREAAQLLKASENRDQSLQQFCTETFGLDTLRDILEVLSRPLDFDERQDSFLPLFHSCAMSLTELQPGMRVTGRIENVTTFGAFCDIGVHQDAYIPRHLYPGGVKNQNATAKKTGALFSLRLGDRISAIVGQVQPSQGRITLQSVEVLPPVGSL